MAEAAAEAPKMKAPPSAYILFCTDKRESIKQGLPADANTKDIMKAVGAAWKALDADAKSVYSAQHDLLMKTSGYVKPPPKPRVKKPKLEGGVEKKPKAKKEKKDKSNGWTEQEIDGKKLFVHESGAASLTKPKTLDYYKRKLTGTKRPPSAYSLYVKANYQKHGGMAACGTAWKGESSEMKEQFIQMSKTLKAAAADANV